MAKRLKILILFAIVCVLIGQSDMDAFEDSLQENDSFENYQLKESANSPIIASNRIKRGVTGEFDEFHSKMTLAARVFAGISIRLGIHDDSIPGDELVAELMNLDSSVKLEDVEKFDKQKVDGFFWDLLALDITEDKEQKKVEEGILIMHEWAELYKNIGDTKNGKAIEDYIDAVKQFNSSFLDTSFTSEVSSSITHSISDIGIYKSSSQRQDASSFVSTLKSLKANLDKLRTVAKDIQILYSQLSNQQHLVDESFIKTDAFRMGQLVEVYTNGQPKTNQPSALDEAKTVNMFKLIGSLNGTYDQIAGQLIGVTGILESQFGQPIVRKHTSGLVNGYNDLTKLSTDAKDSWITSAIDYYDGNMISTELNPLQSLFDKSKTLSSKWSSLNTKANYQKLEKVMKVIKLFNNTKIMATEGASRISNINTLRATKPPIVSSSMGSIINNVFIYREMISAFIGKLKIVWNITTKLEELAELADYIGFTSAADPSELEGVLANMTNFQRIDDLERVLTELKPIMESFDVYNNVKFRNRFSSTSSDIVSQKPEVKKMFEDTNMPGLLTYFEKVKNSSDDLQKLSEAVQLVEHIREIKRDVNFVNVMKTVTQTISNSIPEVTALRSVPSTIKSTVTPEMSELFQLQNFQTESKEFRDAVTVVDKVHTVIHKKDMVEKMMNGGWNIVSAIGTLVKVVEQEPILYSWGEFRVVWNKLNDLISDLTRRTDLVAQVGLKLVDNGRNFVHFQGLTDLKVDISMKLKAIELLEELATSTPPNLAEVKEGLKLLKSIGMNFASYDAAVSFVDQSINSIILSFQSSSQQSVSPSLSPPVTRNDKRPADSLPLNEEEEEDEDDFLNGRKSDGEESWYSGYEGIIFPLALFFTLTLIVISFCFVIGWKDRRRYEWLKENEMLVYNEKDERKKRKKEEKEEKKKEEKEKKKKEKEEKKNKTEKSLEETKEKEDEAKIEKTEEKIEEDVKGVENHQK